MKKKLMVLLVAFITALFLAACNNDTNNEEAGTDENQESTVTKEDIENIEDDQVVATVNGKEIFGSDFHMMYNTTLMMFGGQELEPGMMMEQTMNALIEQEVLMQEVEGKGYALSEEEVEDYLNNEIIVNFESEEAFLEQLEGTPYTLETYKDQLAKSLAIDAYVQGELSAEVTDEDVRAYYDDAVAQIESENEESEEKEEIPPFEELEADIRAYLEENNINQQLNVMVVDLMETAEVERLV